MGEGRVEQRVEISQLLEKWKSDYRAIESSLQRLCTDIQSVNPPTIGVRHAIGAQLADLRRSVDEHFANEQLLCDLIANSRGAMAYEISGVRQRAHADQKALANRLDRITRSLQDSPWQDFATELSLFVDAFEDHDERESQALTWLAPTQDLATPTSKESI